MIVVLGLMVVNLRFFDMAHCRQLTHSMILRSMPYSRLELEWSVVLANDNEKFKVKGGSSVHCRLPTSNMRKVSFLDFFLKNADIGVLVARGVVMSHSISFDRS
jgi:hypothetical protein